MSEGRFYFYFCMNAYKNDTSESFLKNFTFSISSKQSNKKNWWQTTAKLN